MLFFDKLSQSFSSAPENSGRLCFFICTVVIWGPWLFCSCVKLVLVKIKMPFGISLRTSQYFHTHGARIAISNMWCQNNTSVRKLFSKAARGSEIRESISCWKRDCSLCHHECDCSFWWMCLDLKKYSSLRALEDGGKLSFSVLVSCGEQEHRCSWYSGMYT